MRLNLYLEKIIKRLEALLSVFLNRDVSSVVVKKILLKKPPFISYKSMELKKINESRYRIKKIVLQ